MRILFSPEYSGAVFARANDGSDVMMDTVVLNTVGLIDMLELRLGLHYEDIPQNERLAHYYDAVCKYMAENPENIMSASFKTSGLGTAKAMLAWRDELRGVNWDFDGEKISERLAALIEVEKHFRKMVGADMAGRLHIVTDQVDSQKPDCRDMHIELAVSRDLLLPTVKKLFASLEENGATFSEIATAPQQESNLSKVRNLITQNQKGKIRLNPEDDSIVIYRFPDEKSACEYLTFCEMKDVDLWINAENKQMDDWMRLMGRPLTGSSIADCSPQVTQLFVMGLGMFSTPLNVNTLIEWLNMPVHPLSRYFRSALADAIVQKGGYRNDTCRKIIKNYIDGTYVYLDSDQRALPEEKKELIRKKDIKKRQKKAEIFLPSLERTESISVADVRRFVSELSSWARQRAHTMADESANPQWVEQLSAVAGMCDAFHILLGTVSADTIDYKTIDSWMSTIYQKNVYTNAIPEVGCRIVVDSSSKIASVSGKTVWVGVDGDASNSQACAFLYPSERNQLLESRYMNPRSEEAENAYYERMMQMPLVMTEHQLVLVVRDRIGGEPALKHPLIVRLEQQIENIEDIIITPRIAAEDKHECDMVENGGVSAELKIDHADKIKWPGHLSPTRIGTLVEYPFDYLMEQLLCIVPDGKAQMANVKTTKGNVAHAVIDRLFSPRDGQKYSLPEEVKQRIDDEFDKTYTEVLEANGALLLLAENKLAEKLLHEQLRNCLDSLLEILSENGLKVTGCERHVEADMNLGLPKETDAEGNVKERDILGFIDMTLEDMDGHPVVFDFKWTTWAKGYQEFLEENRSVQLELYRWMLSRQESNAVERVAYFLMPDGRLYSKEPFEGRFCTQINAANNDDIVKQLRNSIIYRQQQLKDGIVETNGSFTDLQYVKDTEDKELFPLKEEGGTKKEFFFTKYGIFNN